MANPFSKGWKYLMQSLDTKIEENADPMVQIQQATEAARKQHREITEQAAAVIGNRNQLEMKLGRLQQDAQKLADNARMAIKQADQAGAAGDQAKAQELNQTAEVFASQLVTVEQELEETKQLHAGAVEAAKQAEQQQKQSAMRLEEQMGQINQLRSQVEQAKMQEATAESVQRMNGVAADDSVPTLDGVREKIEQRYAQALGSQELVENSVQGRMVEIEEAGRDMRAASRLEQIRAGLRGDKDGEIEGGAVGEQRGEIEP
ncbi:PspA/IM30 family protein [Corynebacterium falsenii]|uniref:PspA/IM30 family protein n=1 Tax=Corynebacterium falsenii TaxID=108486 RepID=UPI003FCF1D9C